MEESAKRDVGRWALIWAAASVPLTAICTGIAMALEIARDDRTVPFSPGAVGGFVLGVLVGGAWSLGAMFPRYFLFLLWARLCRVLGEADQSRALILVGMVPFSLPEALVARAFAPFEVFFFAWPAIAVGLFLPRLLLSSLRPGIFVE